MKNYETDNEELLLTVRFMKATRVLVYISKHIEPEEEEGTILARLSNDCFRRAAQLQDPELA